MLFIFFVKNATEKGNILEKAKIPQEAQLSGLNWNG
jgi:hypothetical protein